MGELVDLNEKRKQQNTDDLDRACEIFANVVTAMAGVEMLLSKLGINTREGSLAMQLVVNQKIIEEGWEQDRFDAELSVINNMFDDYKELH